MSDPVPSAWRNLPPGLAADAVRQDQDARWGRGDRIPVERYLAALPRLAASPDDALVVIYGEVLNRAAAGETCDMSEYARRFPELTDRLADIFAVHGALSGHFPPAPPAGPTPVPPLVPGFRDLTYIGRGGMGVVFRGIEEATGRPAAVKLVADAAAGSETLVRFLQEAEILGRLRHPNIVRLLASGLADGQLFLASEWVAGGTLWARIDRRPQPTSWGVKLIAAVASAVEHAHQVGVIHRDIKSLNVLLTEEDEPKLADFGVAHWAAVGGTLTTTGQLLGTANYVAPEQVRRGARPVGPAADVYGLGAVLYECLTGRPPFAGSGALDVLERVETELPPPPSALNGLVPPWLDEVCMRCLAKEPSARFPSARQLADALVEGLRAAENTDTR